MHYLIKGYYGVSNVGDDLMLYLLLEQLSALDETARYTILISPKGRKELVSIPVGCNASIQVAEKISELYSILGRVDVCIFGGGTCFHRFGFCGFWLNVVSWLRRKPYYWIGIGAGDVGGKWLSVIRAKLSLWLVSGVTFRDQESLDLVKKYGRINNVEISDDLAFLVSDSRSLSWQDETGSGGLQSFLLLNWRGLNGYMSHESEQYALKVVAQAVVQFAEKNNFDRIVVALLGGEVDRTENKKLYAHLRDLANNKDSMNIELFEDTSLTARLELISNARLVVSGRLHGFVLGKILGCPAVGINYAEKVLNFATSLNRANILNVSDLTNGKKVVNILQREFDTPAKFTSGLERRRHRAKLNIDFLAKLLNLRSIE